MQYNSESLEIKLVISVNVVLFKDIKISFGAFNYCTENARSISGKSLPRDVNMALACGRYNARFDWLIVIEL